MLCVRCENRPIRYKGNSLCYGCDRREKSLAHLDDMVVNLCAGGCGKRVHNMPMIVVPGIVQGHGPGREWCSACVLTVKPEPRAERIVKNRGLCPQCKRPMMRGKPEEGFVRHKAKGLCTTCYEKHSGYVRRGINQGELNRAAKLQTGDVLEIRRLYATEPISQLELAEMYGVSHRNIHAIVRRKSWRHLPARIY